MEFRYDAVIHFSALRINGRLSNPIPEAFILVILGQEIAGQTTGIPPILCERKGYGGPHVACLKIPAGYQLSVGIQVFQCFYIKF